MQDEIIDSKLKRELFYNNCKCSAYLKSGFMVTIAKNDWMRTNKEKQVFTLYFRYNLAQFKFVSSDVQVLFRQKQKQRTNENNK